MILRWYRSSVLLSKLHLSQYHKEHERGLQDRFPTGLQNANKTASTADSSCRTLSCLADRVELSDLYPGMLRPFLGIRAVHLTDILERSDQPHQLFLFISNSSCVICA